MWIKRRAGVGEDSSTCTRAHDVARASNQKKQSQADAPPKRADRKTKQIAKQKYKCALDKHNTYIVPNASLKQVMGRDTSLDLHFPPSPAASPHRLPLRETRLDAGHEAHEGQ